MTCTLLAGYKQGDVLTHHGYDINFVILCNPLLTWQVVSLVVTMTSGFLCSEQKRPILPFWDM